MPTFTNNKRSDHFPRFPRTCKNYNTEKFRSPHNIAGSPQEEGRVRGRLFEYEWEGEKVGGRLFELIRYVRLL